jgi:hypothetical protein
MKLSQFISALQKGQKLDFALSSGGFVPAHYHMTEIGTISKDFIDCGGTMRSEKKINFQLWFSHDEDHRLTSEKLLGIIKVGQERIGLADLDIEIEYQEQTIGKFGLELEGDHFKMTSTKTACLAEELCGIPAEKPKLKMAEIQGGGCCTPESGCC